MKIEFNKIDPKFFEEYRDELKSLGWCIECQGYGQNPSDGSVCVECNGTGKKDYK